MTEDEEIEEAASQPLFPAILDTRTPPSNVKVVSVSDCALSTLQAVVTWISTSIIVFA